jgi:hypothetical protein
MFPYIIILYSAPRAAVAPVAALTGDFLSGPGRRVPRRDDRGEPKTRVVLPLYFFPLSFYMGNPYAMTEYESAG